MYGVQLGEVDIHARGDRDAVGNHFVGRACGGIDFDIEGAIGVERERTRCGQGAHAIAGSQDGITRPVPLPISTLALMKPVVVPLPVPSRVPAATLTALCRLPLIRSVPAGDIRRAGVSARSGQRQHPGAAFVEAARARRQQRIADGKGIAIGVDIRAAIIDIQRQAGERGETGAGDKLAAVKVELSRGPIRDHDVRQRERAAIQIDDGIRRPGIVFRGC